MIFTQDEWRPEITTSTTLLNTPMSVMSTGEVPLEHTSDFAGARGLKLCTPHK